jgi:hypothetical protein
MLRVRAHIISSTVASIERRPLCITGEISAAASLVTTLVKPQTKQHSTIVAKATESKGFRLMNPGAERTTACVVNSSFAPVTPV